MPSGDGLKFVSLIDALNLDQLVIAPTHLHGHTLDLVLSPSGQHYVGGIKVREYISDHALVECSSNFPHPIDGLTKIVSFRKYHSIDIIAFRSELREVPFVKTPANTLTELLKQYEQDLCNLLDRHAPIISRRPKKLTAQWLSESYHRAKTLKRQFERTWHKNKNIVTRARLCSQIAHCNHLINRDKCNF